MNWTSRTTVADSHLTLYHKGFSINQATKDLGMLIDENRVWNYQKIAMCSYIYYGTPVMSGKMF